MVSTQASPEAAPRSFPPGGKQFPRSSAFSSSIRYPAPTFAVPPAPLPIQHSPYIGGPTKGE